ncbi:MAG: TolC family protein [Nitrospiria bacterium]
MILRNILNKFGCFSIAGLTFLLFLLAGFPETGVAIELPDSSEITLSLKEALDLAVHRNPNVKVSLKNFESFRAQEGQVKSGYYPQLEADLSYTRSTNNYAPQPGLGSLPAIPGLENDVTYPFYSASLSFKQLLFDFGKLNSQNRSANMVTRSSFEDLKTSESQIALNVKQAYYGLLQYLQIVKVQQDTVQQMEEHLVQAEGFFQAGSKPKFDVTKARVDLTNARLSLITAENNVQVSRVTLNNAIGLPVDTFVLPADSLKFDNKEPISLAEASRIALEQRPELTSVRFRKAAGLSNLENAKQQYYPTLSASGGYAYRNEDFPLVYNWNIGATLTFPFFSGFQTRYQVDQFQANYESYSFQEEVEIQTVLLEVRQAWLNIFAGIQQIKTAQVIVQQSEENLDLAKGRYTAGVGAPIEITDAEVSYSNAKTSLVQALYNYNAAFAQFEKATGKEMAAFPSVERE